jgi:hypothetical protein
MTPRMQKLLEQLGRKPAKVKWVLEANPSYPLIAKLRAVLAENKDHPRLKLRTFSWNKRTSHSRGSCRIRRRSGGCWQT